MLDASSITNVVLTFAVTFIVTFVATPIIGKVMKRFGKTGRDVHKPSRVILPEMCGLAILLGLVVGSVFYAVVFPSATRVILAFIGTILIAGGIGFIDDLRPLNAKIKPLLTAVACLPILLLGTYDPFPTIPLLGQVRLTLVYPLLILLAIAVTSNSVNMMDVMNGAMSGTGSIIAAIAAAVLVLSGRIQVATLSVALLAALLAFYYYNRFPAKVFGGDTGSLAVGASFGALAVLGSIETVMIVALIPHIMNAFYGLASVGRLYERREIRERPIKLLKNGKLKASSAKGAPITLARLILAAGPLSEREIVRGMVVLTLISSILAAITFAITSGGRI